MIHPFKLNGYNIILDVNSGSIHNVDDVAYDVICLYENTPKEEIEAVIQKRYPEVTPEDLQDIFDDIETLKQQNKLFTEDPFEDMAIDFKKRQSVIKALCLHVAHDCNLRCAYCFAGEGEYKGERSLMSYEVGKRAFDFLIENSGTRKNLEVDFFGGEPLMNFEVVKKLVAYGREQEKLHNKNFRFTITTNGVLLTDDVMDFCNKEMSNVVLSMDGRPEVNDRLRKTRNGGGSYELIVPRFLEMARRRGQKDYYMRGTYTH